MKRNKNKKGFTIVELVIVIGVIGILSAILIPTFVSLTAKADTAALKSNCANAYSMYAAVAADRKADHDEYSEIPAEDPEEMVFVAQTEVQLDKDGKHYVYKSGEWQEGTLTLSGTLTNVGESVDHSTFNGFLVQYDKVTA